MRDIKFRAWDGKKMRGWGFVSPLMFASPPTESGAFDYPHMQFTGLKDKNGKEIYEGDILAKENVRARYEVIFHKGVFCHEMMGAYHIFSGKEVEVIGNIYENPELLNV